MNVRQYATAREAGTQYSARAFPAFARCIQLFNLTDLVDEDGADLAPGTITRLHLPQLEAAVYQQPIDYTFEGNRKTMFMTRAYLAKGRYFATLSIQRCCQDYDRVFVEDLIRAMSQRLDAHAPTT
jgi:hypothetical protein